MTNNQTILLITDDPKTAQSVREGLGDKHTVETAASQKAAEQFLRETQPALIIIDHDLRGQDGLQLFKNLRPAQKVIMLSGSGSIPLAVTATKLGVAEFLRKPLASAQLKAAVADCLAEAPANLDLSGELAWLQGRGGALNNFFAELRRLFVGNKDLVLTGERGIEKLPVAELLHFNRNRKFVALNLTAFKGEAMEPHFWTTLQELLALPETNSLQQEEERCGTLFLDRFDELDETFQGSLLNFLADRPGRVDRSVRVIIGVSGERNIGQLEKLVIPPLRERKEDLPALLAYYLKKAGREYDLPRGDLAVETMVTLSQYDWPGNYAELEALIRSALLTGSFSFSLSELARTSLESSLGERLSLSAARREAEKRLYSNLLEQTGNDRAAAARFLDQPRDVLSDRLEDLAD